MSGWWRSWCDGNDCPSMNHFSVMSDLHTKGALYLICLYHTRLMYDKESLPRNFRVEPIQLGHGLTNCLILPTLMNITGGLFMVVEGVPCTALFVSANLHEPHWSCVTLYWSAWTAGPTPVCRRSRWGGGGLCHSDKHLAMLGFLTGQVYDKQW